MSRFSPANTLDISEGEQFSTATGATDYLTALEAPALSQPPVHYVLPQNAGPVPCAFGGCLINDRNEVLGADFFSAASANPTEAVYTLGVPSSLTVLPISSALCCLPVALNNQSQILFNANAAARGSYPVPTLYNITTRKMMRVPIATQACPNAYDGYPIGLSNTGEVLGTYYEKCASSYFIWDPVHGARQLDPLIPANDYTGIYPLGVNDNGQILVQLVKDGVYDWGTLDPVAPAAAAKRARALR